MQYVVGDLFKAIENRNRLVIIPHITNDIGAWGSGFVVPLGEKYPEAKRVYLEFPAPLGGSHHIYDENDEVVVVNMCAQSGTINKYNPTPIRYAALAKCLFTVRDTYYHYCEFVDGGTEIHAPCFGSNRSGGDWYIISTLIREVWEDFIDDVYIYSLSNE